MRGLFSLLAKGCPASGAFDPDLCSTSDTAYTYRICIYIYTLYVPGFSSLTVSAQGQEQMLWAVPQIGGRTLWRVTYPKALRTQILRFSGPNTRLQRAFGLF